MLVKGWAGAAGVGVALLAACAPASTQRSSVATAGGSTNASALPAGLRAGEHEYIVDGVRFWYRVGGNPTTTVAPVVFLHGGPGYNSYSFARLVGPRLEGSLLMVYFDQRGSGRSERPWTRDYALGTLVDDIEALREQLGVERINVIGHSFGGTLGLEYAAKYPERVSRFAFVGGLSDAVVSCRQRVERLRARYPDEVARALADTANRGVKDCDLEFRALRREEREAFNDAGIFQDSASKNLQARIDSASGLRNTGEMSRALFGSGMLDYRFSGHARLTMPVLVLHGRNDLAVGAEAPRELARALPNARFVEYESAAHFPYLNDPERFARDIVAFFTEPWTGTGRSP